LVVPVTTTASFRFATAILRRLGEELNPSMDQGVLELVKNSYDADAMSCTVTLNSIETVGGTIEIVDDGLGMTPKEIGDGWLVLGASGKEGQTQTKTLHRVPTGSKGLGRLACLRMGTKVTLVTRPAEEPANKYTLEIDWNEYDEAKTVEAVELTIKQSKRGPKEKNGTRVAVQNLRKPVARTDVERLARALILLADPFGDVPNGFTPTLEASEFKDLGKLVEKRYFEEADYRIIARVKDGVPSAQITDWKGKDLHTAEPKDILPKKRKSGLYAGPDATFELWAFKLAGAEFENRPVRVTEVRNWLKQFGGVHVYVDTLRVPPYGNPGNDWLDMNLRRVRSPEERPGTNTSIGRVRLSDVGNKLKQKTDRSGFIENEPFTELRSFLQDVLDWAGRKRLAEAEVRRGNERTAAPKATRKTKKQLDDALKKVPKNQRKQLETAINAWQRSKDKEVDTLRREVELYRTLSTAGITAATFAHESTGNPLKVITVALNSIESRGKRDLGTASYGRSLADPVGMIRRSLGSLNVLGMATLRLLEGTKRRVGRVEVHESIKSVVTVFQPFFEGRQVEIDLQLAKGGPYLRGTEASIESIVTNLLNNSLSSFESADAKQRRIEVKTHLEDLTLILEVLDNGPGITGIEKDEIWLPGYTTRKGGTGLGLTIVRDVAKDLGGSVAVEEKGVLGGATFKITLPILGA
jgi:signal transduction histidine kinase